MHPIPSSVNESDKDSLNFKLKSAHSSEWIRNHNGYFHKLEVNMFTFDLALFSFLHSIADEMYSYWIFRPHLCRGEREFVMNYDCTEHFLVSMYHSLPRDSAYWNLAYNRVSRIVSSISFYFSWTHLQMPIKALHTSIDVKCLDFGYSWIRFDGVGA